jgi:hypothetical protein
MAGRNPGYTVIVLPQELEAQNGILMGVDYIRLKPSIISITYPGGSTG